MGVFRIIYSHSLNLTNSTHFSTNSKDTPLYIVCSTAMCVAMTMSTPQEYLRIQQYSRSLQERRHRLLGNLQIYPHQKYEIESQLRQVEREIEQCQQRMAIMSGMDQGPYNGEAHGLWVWPNTGAWSMGVANSRGGVESWYTAFSKTLEIIMSKMQQLGTRRSNFFAIFFLNAEIK